MDERYNRKCGPFIYGSETLKKMTLEQKQSHSMSKAIVSKWQSENIKEPNGTFFDRKDYYLNDPRKKSFYLLSENGLRKKGLGRC